MHCEGGERIEWKGVQGDICPIYILNGDYITEMIGKDHQTEHLNFVHFIKC